MAHTQTTRDPDQRWNRKAQRYWESVTEGASLEQLWKQFSSDAQQSYALYSREVNWDEIEAQKRKPFARWLRGVWAMFQALLMKLSPARRVLLLVAMLLVLLPLPATIGGAAGADFARILAIGSVLLFGLLALELADRVTMKRDLEIAREIQRWLVPATPPSIPGVEIAFATRPANTVAGDYYDVLRHPANDSERWLVVVADVAGKSMPAALLMATFQASLHTLLTTVPKLSDLIAGLNRYACDHSQDGRRFTTALFAEYEPSSRRLTYVNAGHNPAILRRANGSFEFLASTGLPLGIPAPQGVASTYAETTLQLASGDTLIIFTDGLVEATNAQGWEFGEDRLLAALRAPVQETAPVLLSRLLGEVGFFVGETRQQDDITCLVFRCGPA
jgi:serine phosphatase RsbU (regulator of sigma subunit)